MIHKQSRDEVSVLETARLETARLEALFASIGEGVIAVDESGMITRVNQVALDILEMKEPDVLHERYMSIVRAVHDNGQEVSNYERPMARAFMTGKTVSTRTLFKQKSGALLPVQVTVSPILYEGRPIGAIEVFRDLTDEIESDKMKSDFISIASHQLRTPLSAINMYTRMLQDGLAGPLSEQQEPFIQTILASVNRMNELIDTLLNITRIEAGGVTVKPRLVHLNQLADDIVKEFIPAAKEKSIELDRQIAEDLPAAFTDPLLVKEVFANLLSNAIKYTPSGGKVCVRLYEKDQELQWEVKDNGYGIPAAEQKNIFLKFFRADNITNKDVSGTGLGLYLIKSIAEALGGDLWFDSAENKGSTFYFSIPKDVQGQPARSAASSAKSVK